MMNMTELTNKWQIISADKLNEWHASQKVVKFKENDCTLTVNKTSANLKLPGRGYLSGKVIDASTPRLLHDALLQAEANEISDIKTIMKFHKYLDLRLPRLSINIKAVSLQQGVAWVIGNCILPIEEYPTVSDVTEHLFSELPDVYPGESFMNYPKSVWVKLRDMDYCNPVVLREFHDGTDYEWSFYFDSLDLRTDQRTSRYDESSKMFSFSIDSYEQAVMIREQIILQQWDQLLKHCYDRSGEIADRFTAFRRVTEAADVELNLSNDAKSRGFWIAPSDHSTSFGGERFQTTITEKHLAASTLEEAKLFAVNYRQERQPSFNLLTWSVINSLMNNGPVWSIEENNARLDHFHGRLTVQFFGLNDYPKVVPLPSDFSFDQALIDAWHRNDGYLKKN